MSTEISPDAAAVACEDDAGTSTVPFASAAAAAGGGGGSAPFVPSAFVPGPVKPALSKRDNNNNNNGNGKGGGNKKGGRAAARKRGDVHLKWDEDKIKEHDELRGTRMKIDEPNTPFHQYDSGSETDGSIHSAKHLSKWNKDEEQMERTNISWDTLQTKLEVHAVAAQQQQLQQNYPPSSPSSHGGGAGSDNNYRSDDGEDNNNINNNINSSSNTDRNLVMREELKELEFKEHRKRHYNEMELVRKYRQEHAQDDDGDDEDDDGGDEADDEHDE